MLYLYDKFGAQNHPSHSRLDLMQMVRRVLRISLLGSLTAA